MLRTSCQGKGAPSKINCLQLTEERAVAPRRRKGLASAGRRRRRRASGRRRRRRACGGRGGRGGEPGGGGLKKARGPAPVGRGGHAMRVAGVAAPLETEVRSAGGTRPPNIRLER